MSNWYVTAAKGYVPRQRLDIKSVVEEAFQNIDWSSGDGEMYHELAEERLNNEGDYRDEEQPDDPEYNARVIAMAEKICRDQLTYQAEEILAQMMDWTRRFPVWRAITVQQGATPDDTIKNINLTPVGEYWSWTERAAQCHWGHFDNGSVKVKLRARIGPSVVDWHSTLTRNIEPSIGQDEKEVTLIEGSQIIIDQIIFENRPMRVRLTATV